MHIWKQWRGKSWLVMTLCTQTSEFRCLSGAGASLQTPVYCCTSVPWHSKVHCLSLSTSTTASTRWLQGQQPLCSRALQNLLCEKGRFYSTTFSVFLSIVKSCFWPEQSFVLFPTIQLLMRQSVIFSEYVQKVLISMCSSAWYNYMADLQIYRYRVGFCCIYWNHSHNLQCCTESHDYFGFLFLWEHGSYVSNNQKDYFGKHILLETTLSVLYDIYSCYATQMFECIWCL